MQEVYQFLKKCQTYYLATVEGDQPRVRPFGTVNIFEGKLYIQTGKIKDVAKQMMANPKIEICAFDGNLFPRAFPQRNFRTDGRDAIFRRYGGSVVDSGYQG